MECVTNPNKDYTQQSHGSFRQISLLSEKPYNPADPLSWISKTKVARTERIVQEVKNMELRHIRQIMSLFCNPNVTSDHYLPQFGFTLGEFCVAYVVRQN